jgi:hypothetical protein
MNIDKLDLLKKGWSVQEIEHASQIIARAESKKHITVQFFDRSIYWALLFLLVIANIVGAIFFLPFMFTINNFFIFFISGILGFTFGTLFSVLVRDIEKTEHKRYANLKYALLLAAVVNFFLIIGFAKDFGNRSGLSMESSPILVAVVFLVAYLLPHGVYMYMENQKQ